MVNGSTPSSDVVSTCEKRLATERDLQDMSAKLQSQVLRESPIYNLARQFDQSSPLHAAIKASQQVLRESPIYNLARQFDQSSPLHEAIKASQQALRESPIYNLARQFDQSSPLHEAIKASQQALRGSSIHNRTQQAEWINSTFSSLNAVRKSFNVAWEEFQETDFNAYEADERQVNKAAAEAQSIVQASSDGEPTLKDAVDQIIAAIHVQESPTVKLMLFMCIRKILDWLIAGAIGAVISGYYTQQIQDSGSGMTAKAVKEIAHRAVGAPELLIEYRYVSVKQLVVRQNPRARSPEVGRFTFGKIVKIIKKDKDFSLVLWADEESGMEIQGWVFSRYLGKFN